MIRGFVIVMLLSGAVEAWGQAGAPRSAMRALGNEKWQKCRSILQKALRKDSTASGTHYGFSRYYFTPSNPAFDIDSAYLFVNKALAFSPVSDRKSRQQDIPDSTIFLSLRQQIDSAAFDRAKLEHSERSYIFFIGHFPSAAQADTARWLRDAVAWHDAVKENSPEGFAKYLEKYPASRYAGEARSRHDELLFKINTKDQRLSSFESFLAEYPGSPYRHLVEEQILEIFTAEGVAEKFSGFLRRYPQGAASRKARDILYHIALETESSVGTFSFWNDSLRHIHHLNAGFLVPFMTDRKFGFMDTTGKEIIAANSGTLYGDYRCGNIRDDVIVSGANVISRDGTVVFSGHVRELSDLGYGFIGIQSDDCYHVRHKSGFAVGAGCAKDAFVMEGRFLAISAEDGWSVYTLAGRLLTSGWDEVQSMGTVIALRDREKWTLHTVAQLAMVADQQPLERGLEADDIRAWSDHLIWARKGSTEAVLDENLRIIIPFSEQELRQEAFGIVSRSPGCCRLYAPARDVSHCADDVKFNSSWVFVNQNEEWSPYDPVNDTATPSFDSVAFMGTFAAGYRGDTVRVFFNDSTHLDFTEVELDFIAGRDTGAFLQVERHNRKTIYDQNAVKLFDGYFDAIQHAGGDYFIAERNEKEGLITSKGEQALPFAYDAIGEIEGSRIPLLRALRFGLYDVVGKKVIRPAYDKQIVPYNTELLVGFRQGKAGMIDFNNRVKVPFQYDAFRFWNDTSALARQDNIWKIVDLATNEQIIGDIHDFSVVEEANGEIVAIIRRGTDFGVLSSTRGEIIPVRYTDLVNIGSAEHPFYFSEKHVREAALSVVIYYDENGRPVRHQALEPDEFDAIYCEEN